MEKSGRTQIIINIAGKRKKLGFSNKAVAAVFIRDASKKFGKKFKLIASEVITLKPGDHISWHLDQFNTESRHGTVIDVLPKNDNNLIIFNAKQKDLGGNDKGEVWGYMGLIWEINGRQVKPIEPYKAEFEIVKSQSPQQDVDNNKPVTSGFGGPNTGDLNDAAPNFKEASDQYPTPDQFEHCHETLWERPSDYAEWVDKQAPDKSRQQQEKKENMKMKAAAVNKKYKIHTSPTLVKSTAEKLRDAGCKVTVEGTENVHFTTDKPREEVLRILREPYQAETGAVGWSDRDIKEGSVKKAANEYVIRVGVDKFVALTPLRIVDSINEAYHFGKDEEVNSIAVKVKDKTKQPVKVVPVSSNHLEASIKEAGGMNFSPSNVPSQVIQQFYPELQHELIDYPNVTNAPMINPEVSGDTHELGIAPAEGIGEATLQIAGHEGETILGALENTFNKLTVISYVSTSPAGAAGIGRDGKPQILEGAPLRKENDIRGPMFTDEFYINYQEIPGAALASLKEKVAGADEKKQFSIFLKRVMGEIAASFIAAFKVTSKMPMNKVPGIGEIQLAQVEQATNLSVFNIVNTGSRVKYLMDKLNDSEIQDAINDAYAQGAVWHEGKEGGFVYEVFVRAENIDTESMILSYRFITGTKD